MSIQPKRVARGHAYGYGSTMITQGGGVTDLSAHVGRWVAIKNDQVIASEASSRQLVAELRRRGASAWGAKVRYVSATELGVSPT